jgi:RAB protein geranylgeranyltransferase component A
MFFFSNEDELKIGIRKKLKKYLGFKKNESEALFFVNRLHRIKAS